MRRASQQGTNREPETETPGAFGDHRNMSSNVAGTKHWDNGEAVPGEGSAKTVRASTRGPADSEKTKRAHRHHA